LKQSGQSIAVFLLDGFVTVFGALLKSSKTADKALMRPSKLAKIVPVTTRNLPNVVSRIELAETEQQARLKWYEATSISLIKFVNLSQRSEASQTSEHRNIKAANPVLIHELSPIHQLI
jgi:hypothetical protein